LTDNLGVYFRAWKILSLYFSWFTCFLLLWIRKGSGMLSIYLYVCINVRLASAWRVNVRVYSLFKSLCHRSVSDKYGHSCFKNRGLQMTPKNKVTTSSKTSLTSWSWVVSFTPRPLYPRGKSSRYPLDRRMGRSQDRPERRGEKKILPPRTRTPACSHWLYRRRHPGSLCIRILSLKLFHSDTSYNCIY
jgi:hypothetical protein